MVIQNRTTDLLTAPTAKSVLQAVFAATALALIGILIVGTSRAGTVSLTLEAENGQVTAPAAAGTDPDASKGSYASFNSLAAAAQQTELSAHTLYFDSNRTGNYEIFERTVNGTITELTQDPSYDSWWAKPSPDGTKVLFYRTPSGVHDSDYGQTSLWMMNSDGSNQHLVLANKANGWASQGHAEWSPDGTRLVMFAGTNGTLIVTTNTSGTGMQLVSTPGQTADTDPSWSPDGATVLYTFAGNVWIARIDNTVAPIQLTHDAGHTDYDPYFSPDSSKVAYLQKVTDTAPAGTWAIALINTNGTDPHYLINDGTVNSKPDWTPDGQLVFFHRHPAPAGSTGYFGVWSIAADGSNLTGLDLGNGSNEYPDISNK